MAHELLDGLCPADVNRVLSLGTRLTLHEGTLLFRMGDPAKYLFFIDRGRARLTLPILIQISSMKSSSRKGDPDMQWAGRHWLLPIAIS